MDGADGFDQVIDLTLIASLDENAFPERENTPEWQGKYPMVIEIIDGYCWNVYSQDKEVINFLASNYNDIKVHFQS